jgi:hypothetical protein
VVAALCPGKPNRLCAFDILDHYGICLVIIYSCLGFGGPNVTPPLSYGNIADSPVHIDQTLLLSLVVFVNEKERIWRRSLCRGGTFNLQKANDIAGQFDAASDTSRRTTRGRV